MQFLKRSPVFCKLFHDKCNSSVVNDSFRNCKKSVPMETSLSNSGLRMRLLYLACHLSIHGLTVCGVQLLSSPCVGCIVQYPQSMLYEGWRSVEHILVEVDKRLGQAGMLVCLWARLQGAEGIMILGTHMGEITSHIQNRARSRVDQITS